MKFERIREAISRWNAERPDRKRQRREDYEARIKRYEDAAEKHRGDLSYRSPYLRRD